MFSATLPMSIVQIKHRKIVFVLTYLCAANFQYSSIGIYCTLFKMMQTASNCVIEMT